MHTSMVALYSAIGLRAALPEWESLPVQVSYYFSPFFGNKLRAVIPDNPGPLAIARLWPLPAIEQGIAVEDSVDHRRRQIGYVPINHRLGKPLPPIELGIEGAASA